MIKLGTTSEKKKILLFFLFFNAKNFQKIKYQLEISIKNDTSRFKYFQMIKLGTTSKRKKNITVFFIYLCNKFLQKNFQKIRYQLEISSKNDNSRYKYFHMIKWVSKRAYMPKKQKSKFHLK